MTEWKMPAGVYSMTPRQLECLQVICEWSDNFGRAPTYRQLSAELGNASTFGAFWLVTELEARGWLRAKPIWWPKIEVLHRPPMPDFTEIEWSRAPELVAAQGGPNE